jgi:hypothetical protein
MLVFALLTSNIDTPFDTLAKSAGYQQESRWSLGERTNRASKLRHLNGEGAFVVESSAVEGNAASEFDALINSIQTMSRLEGPSDGRLNSRNSEPIGVIVPVREFSMLVVHGGLKEGELVQSYFSTPGPRPRANLVGTAARTGFTWYPVGYVGRTVNFGKSDKSDFMDILCSLVRWHNSEFTTNVSLSDNIQRVAGREMVTKVDKNQNVYVDMNELSRHRGWNFSISLEPARADVRIGNDHIKIYPGADRIHINDELVTLPGTVPTQGYGVYLPLRLLQERGYLPSEG